MALTPIQETGAELPPAEIHNHLILVISTEVRSGIVTKHTKAGEDPNDAIAVDVAVLTMADEAGKHPIFRGALWFNVGLVRTLKLCIGETKLARMVQGVPTKGSPPWLLEDAMGDPQAVAYAEAWLAANPEFEAAAARTIASIRSQPQAAPAPAPVSAAPAIAPGVPVTLPVGVTAAPSALPSLPSSPNAAARPQLGTPVPQPGVQNITSVTEPAGQINLDQMAMIAAMSEADRNALLLKMVNGQ